MVGPHEGELDAAVVGRLEETLVNRAIEERAVVVVIPVEDEGINAVVGGGGDLPGHDLRIGFVLDNPTAAPWVAGGRENAVWRL